MTEQAPDVNVLGIDGAVAASFKATWRATQPSAASVTNRELVKVKRERDAALATIERVRAAMEEMG